MTYQTRLRALESRVKPQKCPRCYNHPVCINFKDPETYEVWDHKLIPETGCPECGRLPSIIEIVIERVPSSGKAGVHGDGC
jgi:hypothetical protein